jgi:hypothetical protein
MNVFLFFSFFSRVDDGNECGEGDDQCCLDPVDVDDDDSAEVGNEDVDGSDAHR